MHYVIIPVEARLHEFRRQLEGAGLRYPESQRCPGLPHISEIAKIIGTTQSMFGLRAGAPSPARMLLDKHCAEVGFMPYADWQRAISDNPGIAIQRRAEDRDWQTLSAWIEQARKSGLKIPCKDATPGAPYFKLLGKAVDIDPNRLAHPFYPYREAIDNFAREVGFMDAPAFAATAGIELRSDRSVAAVEHKCALVRSYLHKYHIGPEIGLPEAKFRPGTPNYRDICLNAGAIYRGPKVDTECTALIDDAAQLVGVGADGFRPFMDPAMLSYGEFLHRGMNRFILESPEASESNKKRFKSSLRKWQDGLGRIDANQIMDDFDEHYEESLSRIAAAIGNPDTRRHWLCNMRRWHEYFWSTSRDDASLPDDFAGALTALKRRQGNGNWTQFLSSVGLGKHATTVRNWARGIREPVCRDQTLVREVERAFGVEEGILTKRIRKFFRISKADVRDEFWPTALNTPALRKLAKPLLPSNFPYLSFDQREQIGISIRDEAATTIPFRQHMQAPRKKWRLKELPARLQREWDNLVEYKTSLMPILPRASAWRPGTVDRCLNIMTEFESFLALDPADGGLGVDPENLSLAYIASAEVIRRFAEWKLKRSPSGPDTSVRSWLGWFAHLATMQVSDVHGNRADAKGYLHYVPELANALAPIPGVLDERAISRLQTDVGWSEALDQSSRFAANLFKDLRPKLRLARDPFAPILPILELDRPYDVLINMLRDAYNALPDPRRVGEFRRAIAVRRFVTALIVVRTALRRRNIGELSFSAGGRGQIYRTENGWCIQIAASDFKNARSPFFGTQTGVGRERSAFVYHFDAEDTAILDEYANVSRRVLLDRAKKNGCETFLINKLGNPMNHDQMSLEMHDLTWEHVVFHAVTGKGIKGVERFAVHAVRDIMATHVLKTTNNVNLAADSIQDSVPMVMQHYARFLTSDRTKRVQAALKVDLPPANWAA